MTRKTDKMTNYREQYGGEKFRGPRKVVRLFGERSIREVESLSALVTKAMNGA